MYFNNFFPVTHKSCNIHVYSSNSFINSPAVLGLSLLNAAGKVGKGISSLALSLVHSAAELIACPSLASWTSCAFKLSVCKLFIPVLKNNQCLFFIWKFPANVQNILFFLSEWSHLYFSFHDSWNFHVFLIGAAAGVVGVVVGLSILLSSKESIQWALNLFAFGHLSKLYFERKYRCHQGLETRKVIILNPTMHFISE